MNSVIWKTVKIKDIAEINPDSISPKTPKETLINYIDLESVKKGKILGIKKMLFSDAPSRAKRVVKNGDVLFSTVRPYQKNFTIIENEQDNLIASTGFAVLRAKEDNDPRFIYQMLYSDVFMNQIISEMKGSNYPAVNASDVEKVEILLPSLKEQQKIASILSTVDEQIDETEQLIVKTKELKKGLMQQLLTQGIGHTEFKWTEHGEIPVEWEVVQLDEIADVKGGKRLPKGNQLVNNDTGYPYIRVSDMNDKGLEIENILYVPEDIAPLISNYRIFTGELYISVAGTLGLVGIIPQELDGANLTENADRICNLKMDNKYLKYFLESNLIQNNINSVRTTSAQPKLALNQIKSFLILKPCIEEQQKIAQILSTVDEQIEVYEQEKAKYEELKKGLMQQLLTGQIRVKI